MEEGAAFFIGVGASDSAVFMAEAFALFLAGLDAVLSDDDASDGFPVSATGSVPSLAGRVSWLSSSSTETVSS